MMRLCWILPLPEGKSFGRSMDGPVCEVKTAVSFVVYYVMISKNACTHPVLPDVQMQSPLLLQPLNKAG